MASYNLVFKPSFRKDLHHLPKHIIAQALDIIEGLKSDPFPRQAMRLEGTQGLYRIRAGDYRIIYGVETETGMVFVYYIRHRKAAYRNL
jgi:mRNA interferase RelE/StbE